MRETDLSGAIFYFCNLISQDVYFFRYRQQPNVAAGYYLWSWVVHPDSGHSFNQLAILEATKVVNHLLLHICVEFANLNKYLICN